MARPASGILATGRPASRPFKHEHAAIRSLAVSPDGKTLAVATMDLTVPAAPRRLTSTIWRAESG